MEEFDHVLAISSPTPFLSPPLLRSLSPSLPHAKVVSSRLLLASLALVSCRAQHQYVPTSLVPDHLASSQSLVIPLSAIFRSFALCLLVLSLWLPSPSFPSHLACPRLSSPLALPIPPFSLPFFPPLLPSPRFFCPTPLACAPLLSAWLPRWLRRRHSGAATLSGADGAIETAPHPRIQSGHGRDLLSRSVCRYRRRGFFRGRGFAMHPPAEADRWTWGPAASEPAVDIETGRPWSASSGDSDRDVVIVALALRIVCLCVCMCGS